MGEGLTSLVNLKKAVQCNFGRFPLNTINEKKKETEKTHCTTKSTLQEFSFECLSIALTFK